MKANNPSSEEVHVFSSQSDILRLSHVVSSIVGNLKTSLKMGISIGVRDFRAQYKANFLGQFWAVLSPGIYTVAFMVVKGGVRFGDGDGKSEASVLYILIGFTLFRIWLDCLNDTVGLVKKNKAFLTRLSVPIEVLYIGGLTSNLIDLVVRLSLIVVGFIALGTAPASDFWLFPIFAFLMVLNASVIGFLLLPFAALFKDIKNAIQSISLGLLFISPVFYPVSTDPTSLIYKINIVNPIASIMSTARVYLVGGEQLLINPAIFWLIFCVVALAVQTVIMRIITPVIVERLGN